MHRGLYHHLWLFTVTYLQNEQKLLKFVNVLPLATAHSSQVIIRNCILLYSKTSLHKMNPYSLYFAGGNDLEIILLSQIEPFLGIQIAGARFM